MKRKVALVDRRVGSFSSITAYRVQHSSRVFALLIDLRVICRRSHWGRLRVTGRDRLSFLHGQSTAKLTELRPGEQTETVFTTPQVPESSVPAYSATQGDSPNRGMT